MYRRFELFLKISCLGLGELKLLFDEPVAVRGSASLCAIPCVALHFAPAAITLSVPSRIRIRKVQNFVAIASCFFTQLLTY